MKLQLQLLELYKSFYDMNHDNSLKTRVAALQVFIHKNVEALSHHTRECAGIYSGIRHNLKSLCIGRDLIEAIEQVHHRAKLLNKEPNHLAAWFNEFRDETLAERVNENKIALADLSLSFEELCQLAPQLTYVDCRGIPFQTSEEVHQFLKKCAIASEVLIDSDKISAWKVVAGCLQKLDCSGCTSLVKLDCTDCITLRTLTVSNLPSLITLHCSGCTSLTSLTLENLPSLEQLFCSHCCLITAITLSNLKEFKQLTCINCKSLTAMTLSNLLNFKTFNFQKLGTLQTINLSNLPAIKDLSYSSCHSLKAITLSNLASLENLSFGIYPSLTRAVLSDLPQLNSLNLEYFRFLQTVTLSNLLKITLVKIKHCTSLTTLELSNLTALEYFDCSNCINLETIRALNLPRCRHFDHHGCLQLRELPQLPLSCRVISDETSDFTSFTVDPEQIKTEPLEVLCHLGAHLLCDKQMPNIVYLNSPGLDHGGLRRQLVTTLLKNLFVKGSPFAFAEEGIEGVLPFMPDLTDEKQALAFKTLGCLVALALQGLLPLGHYFRNNFYYTLLNLEDECEKTIYRLLHGLPETDEVTSKEVADNLSLIRPIALAAAQFRSIARAREFGLKEFIARVAGEEVTFEAFAEKALFTGEADTTKEYFRRFFEESDLQKVLDMIELFTASRALGPETITIIIQRDKHKESLFEIATCFQQITIPYYETYETFKEKLLKTLEYTLDKFNKA